MRGAAITGIGSALPERLLGNAELAERLDVTEDWILSRTGIESRHIASDSDTTSSLATAAAVEALHAAGRSPQDVDVVIVATITPDYRLPATAPLVVAALGAGDAYAFDVVAACSGFLYALAQATSLVESGAAERVLVCGADVMSRIADYDDPKSAILFGDGAGAAMVEQIEEPTRVGPFRNYTDGSMPEFLWIPPGGQYIEMEGREVFRRAVDGMATAVIRLLDDEGMKPDEVDLLVAHQANARILKAVAARLSLGAERVVTNIARLGNTSGASIPLALADAVDSGLLKKDHRVVLTAFGAGFSWGAGLVQWGSASRATGEIPA